MVSFLCCDAVNDRECDEGVCSYGYGTGNETCCCGAFGACDGGGDGSGERVRRGCRKSGRRGMGEECRRFGSTGIKAPAAGKTSDPWKGSYVWYGKFDGEPVKYRVLAPKTTKFGGTTMFLDCDCVLYKASFRIQGLSAGDTDTNKWADSDVRVGLNGGEFLTKLNGFTQREQNAIAASRVSSHAFSYGSGAGKLPQVASGNYANYTALNGDKVFLLDVEDACNSVYGYTCTFGNTECRKKAFEGQVVRWWLRTGTETYGRTHTGSMEIFGNVTDYNVDNYRGGVSPAFNIKRDYILFSSLVAGEAGKDNAEYKLTLIDGSFSAGAQGGKPLGVFGNRITVPYTSSGTGVNQVSVLILDKEYVLGDTDNTKVIFYGKLDTGTSFSKTGTGSFTLPSDLKVADWGKKYFVYVIAEQVNGIHETDYASVPNGLPALPLVCTSQPKSVSVAEDEVATFSVTVSGNGPFAYQWAVSDMGSNKWAVVKGAVNAQFQYSTQKTIKVRCIIRDGEKNMIHSDEALLKVHPANVTLAFDLNGGTSGAPSPITVKYGASATVPKSSPVRSGYWFLGWAKTKTATSATYKSGSVIPMEEDLTLYAVWKKDNNVYYRLSFDRNGGSGNAPAAMTVASGTVVTVSKCSVTREGYYFMGWSKTRGGAVAYKSGDKVTVTKDTVLYAVWQPRTNTISFSANGGSGTLPAVIKVQTGKKATVGKSSMSRTGYWFLGWATSSAATTAAYKTGSEISVTKDTVLYAVWKKK